MAKKLELAEVVKALRRELYEAKQDGAGESLRFNVNSVDVEFETAVEFDGSVEGGGKIKFFVFDADTKVSGEYKNATTHKIKLSLEPVDYQNPDPQTGKPGKTEIGGDTQNAIEEQTEIPKRPSLGGDS